MGLVGGFCHIKKTILLLVLGGEVTNIESTNQEDERDLYKKDTNWFEPAIVRVVINNSCCFENDWLKNSSKTGSKPSYWRGHTAPIVDLVTTAANHSQNLYMRKKATPHTFLYSFSISDQWPASAAVFSCHLWTSSPVWRQTPQSGLLWSWLTAAHLSIKSLARKVAFWVWKSEHHFFRQWCTLYVKRSAKTAHLTTSDPTAMT